MRPRNEFARERLGAVLRRTPWIAASELSNRLLISLPTVLRMIGEQRDRIIKSGTTKAASYALRRPLRGQIKPITVYRIDRQGKSHECGILDLVEPEGAFMDLRAMGWPIDDAHLKGRWEGLPYPLYDMRPQGFLGRNFALHTYKDLGVSPNPVEWSDSDIVYALTKYGADTSGNLIIGDQALERWLTSVAKPTAPLSENNLPESYVHLALEAASQGLGGSSAAGEFPKFTASRDRPGSGTEHVIVKFSGADNSTAVRRWSDLLVCEHLALEALRAASSLRVAPSRILNAQGRTFIEVERFDRHAIFGRSETVTLFSLDEALLGSEQSSWPDLIRELSRHELATGELELEVRMLWWYGRLIANTDMHLGNLSFQFSPTPGAQPRLSIAPAYDMLPMLYAPLSGGEVPVRKFEPALPIPQDREVWQAACKAALLFWKTASRDDRVGQEFRKICGLNYRMLDELAGRA
jgi:hypothetical protein